jgi:ribose/xylose/arabinose/galactoside ABC-type transport system permease subunit
MSKSFARLGDGSFLGFIPVPVILLILVAVIMSWVLRSTPLARYAYAIGGNPQAAHLSGINLRSCGLAFYSILGGLTGLTWTAPLPPLAPTLAVLAALILAAVLATLSA